MGARFTPATDPLHGGMPLGFVPVSDENVDLLKRINAVIFPLIYRDRFYADIMSKQSMSYLSTPRLHSWAPRLTCSLSGPQSDRILLLALYPVR